MIELLRELHGDREFEIFTNYEKKRESKPIFWSEAVSSINLERIESLNKDKRGVWFTPNSLKNGKRLKPFVETFNAVVLDFDTESEKGDVLDTLLTLQLKPSSIIETKNGYHAYWFLEKGSVKDVDEYETLQRLMKERLGSDSAAIGAERLYRLPNYYHWKDPDNPFLCTEVHRDYEKIYSKESLIHKFGGKKSYDSIFTKKVRYYSSGKPIKINDFNDPGDVKDIVRGCAAFAEIEKKKEPIHDERLALVWTYANLGNDGLEHLRHLAKGWNDYDADVTESNIKYAVQKGYKAPTCDWLISNGICKGRCTDIRDYKKPIDLYYHPVRQLPVPFDNRTKVNSVDIIESKEHMEVMERVVAVLENNGQVLSDVHKGAILSIAKTVMSPIYNDKPICVPAVPGLGKTTFIIEFLKQMAEVDPTYGAVIVVERQDTMDEIVEALGISKGFTIKRNDKTIYSESYYRGYAMKGYSKDYCLKDYPVYKPSQCRTCDVGFSKCRVKFNFAEQQKHPFVVISHSRLFRMSDKDDLLESLRYWKKGGEKHKRKTLLIDEKPKMMDVVPTFSSTWDQLISDTAKFVHGYSNEVNAAVSRVRNIYSYPDEHESVGVLDADFRWSTNFTEDWNSYYMGDYPNYPELLENIITEGGWYSKSEHSVSTIHFSKTYWQDYSTFVFDGTAGLDPEYREDRFYFLDVEQLKTFNNLHIHVCMDRNLSLAYHNKQKNFPEKFSKDILKIAESGKTYVACYKRYEDDYKSYLDGEVNIIIKHYGETRGSNDLIECVNIVCTGILHKGESHYLAKTKAIKGGEISYEVKTPDTVRRFEDVQVEEVKLYDTVTDLVQEIFRTKLRNHSSDEEIHVYLTTRDTQIISALKEYFVGCHVHRDWKPKAIVGDRENFRLFVTEHRDDYKTNTKLVKAFRNQDNKLTPKDLYEVLGIKSNHAKIYLEH